MMTMVIIAMGIYRSPAVALMPDVTPKPLRSKANAIINFVGYIGAIAGTGLTMLFTMDNKNLTVVPFIVTAVVMIGILVLLMFRFKENKVVEEMRADMKVGEELAETLQPVEEGKQMGRRDKINMFIMMSAVFCAFFAFNALNTFGSTFADDILGISTTEWGFCLNALAITSLLTFLPSIKLTKKIGRKYSIMLGLAIIIVSMVIGGILNSYSILLVVLFAFSGMGWAIINVNTLPAIVEMATKANLARMVGVYYIASQIAHALTSIVVGFVFTALGFEVYFFYAALWMSIAFVLCIFFKVRKVPAPVQTDTPLENPNSFETATAQRWSES
jgi:MFS family permease